MSVIASGASFISRNILTGDIQVGMPNFSEKPDL
jgi:hypothetical protein